MKYKVGDRVKLNFQEVDNAPVPLLEDIRALVEQSKKIYIYEISDKNDTDYNYILSFQDMRVQETRFREVELLPYEIQQEFDFEV